MFPILVGFGSALLFGLFAYGLYGPEGVTAYAWVGMVFWALIVSGLLVFLVNRRLPCWVCRMKARWRTFARWCADAPPCG
jgi:hypothetical protein